LKKQKDMASGGARLQALTNMVAKFRGISRREKELAESGVDT
jgi:hypothetical protein